MNPKVARAQIIAKLLDSRFEVLGIRFGVDPIISLIPFVGDIIVTSLSLYILWTGWHLRLPLHKLLVMAFHILMDFLFGLIPFLGDVLDVYYKANMRNMRIITNHVASSDHHKQ